MSGFFFCRQRSYSRSCWELLNTPERLFHLSMTEDVDKLIIYMHSDSRRLKKVESKRIDFSVGIKQTLQQTCFTRKRKLRSKFWWLTRFCNSHDVSHFAAFFIVVGAKTSVAESGLTLRSFAVEVCKDTALRNEFLVNWMFCPLMVEMSEVKIKMWLLFGRPGPYIYILEIHCFMQRKYTSQD